MKASLFAVFTFAIGALASPVVTANKVDALALRSPAVDAFAGSDIVRKDVSQVVLFASEVFADLQSRMISLFAVP